MTAKPRFGGLQNQPLAPEKQAEIVGYVRAGMTAAKAAKRAGVGHAAVLKYARIHGVVNVARGKPGAPKGSRRKKAVAVAPVSQQPNYRALAAGLRWGRGLGGGWL